MDDEDNNPIKILWELACALHTQIDDMGAGWRRIAFKAGEFGASVVLLPLAVMLVVAQLAFEIILRTLDFVMPEVLSITALSFGAGGLKTGIGLTITLIFLLPRYAINLILRFKMFFNVLLLGAITLVYAAICIDDVAGFIADPMGTTRNYFDSWTPQDTQGLKDFLVFLFAITVISAVWRMFTQWLNRRNGFADE